MKKIVPHILFFLISFSTYSQGVFFNMGKNFSTISYKNRSAFTEKLDINGVGDAYEIGYTDVLKYKNFKDLKFTITEALMGQRFCVGGCLTYK